MCSKATCRRCGKTTWSGCGQHVAQVMRGVPEAQQCTCDSRPGKAAGEPAGKAGRVRLAALFRR